MYESAGERAKHPFSVPRFVNIESFGYNSSCSQPSISLLVCSRQVVKASNIRLCARL